MRRNIVLVLFAFVLILPLSAGDQKEWAKIQKEYQSVVKKPGYVVYDVHILVLHPMLKEADRNKAYRTEGELSWVGKQGSQTIVKSVSATPGLKVPAVGIKTKFVYPHSNLIAVLQSQGVIYIENSEERVIEGKTCRGFKIQGRVVGDSKDRFGFVNIDKATGEVVTIEFGARVDGIAPENNESEEMYNFFFKKIGGKTLLYRAATVNTGKKNDVPFIITTDAHYSKFQ